MKKWHETEWSKQWVQVLRSEAPQQRSGKRVQRQSPSHTPDSPRSGLPNTRIRPQTKVTDRGPRRNPGGELCRSTSNAEAFGGRVG